MTRLRCLLLKLFVTSVFLPHYIECAAVRLWVPFGSVESKPAPAVPYGVDVNKAQALTKEFSSDESIITEYQAYSSSDNVHLREKCGETPPITTYDQTLGNVTPTVVEPGLQWSAVLISNDGRYRCGATFISTRHLITAGSCFRNPMAAGTQERVVGQGLYWTMSCRFLIGDMYKEECERHALYAQYSLNMTRAFYVFDQSKKYLQSTASYLEDIAIIELDIVELYENTDIRPACVPSKNATFLQANTFTFALVPSEADESTAVCTKSGIQCVTIPYRSKKLDFWILPGVGVFDKVEGSDKDWHLYGYVLEVVPDDEHQHYNVVIRLVQGLLTTLCYFAGVCSDAGFDVAPSRSSVEAHFNMAYDPPLHNGTKMWMFPNGTRVPVDTEETTIVLPTENSDTRTYLHCSVQEETGEKYANGHLILDWPEAVKPTTEATTLSTTTTSPISAENTTTSMNATAGAASTESASPETPTFENSTAHGSTMSTPTAESNTTTTTIYVPPVPPSHTTETSRNVDMTTVETTRSTNTAGGLQTDSTTFDSSTRDSTSGGFESTTSRSPGNGSEPTTHATTLISTSQSTTNSTTLANDTAEATTLSEKPVRRDNQNEKNIPVETDKIATDLGLNVNKEPGEDASPNEFAFDGPDTDLLH